MTTCSRRHVLRGALGGIALGLVGPGTVLAQAPAMTVYKDPT